MDLTLLQGLIAKKLISIPGDPAAAAVLSKILDSSAAEQTIDQRDAARYLFTVKQTIAEACEEENFQPFRSQGTGKRGSGQAGLRGFFNNTGTCTDFQVNSCSRGESCSYKHTCYICFKKYGSHRYHPAIECRQSDSPGVFPFQGCEHIKPVASKNMHSRESQPQQRVQQGPANSSGVQNGSTRNQTGMASNVLSGNSANLLAALANALGTNNQ